ncbi:MAG: methylenetetrahydrofolate--tRNA-(uracil(54)-C(5))-methyltransferase (FADH(2)-oxidizing) TrmFO, partial [Deltaproteobacteria bacterium]|nr:methylenetetrahydrofolate--tRNA-(uracil(54)-C(5))-methyltransferase (FADH(2)-oxidizing) TrmFO [Deltaproteobacteria bacterium]
QALAVDRERFAAAVTAEIERHPRINVVREECRDVAAESITVIATGPLTSEAFSAGLQQLLGNSFLYFHDAIAPIVEEESIDRQKVFRASRYNKGTADYLNCPLTQDEYYAFIEALLAAEKVPLREFESLVPFEGCMPVEIMAGRGIETLAYGPMKPVGLVDPRTERQSYAVVQLRTENQAETLYNLVGFQTRLKWPEQKRVFGLIPGLEQAVFARYGSMHRNTYIHSPQLLLKSLQLQQDPRVFFAGQITGVEGYLESTAMGLMAGLQAAACSQGNKPVLPPPPTTVVGALLSYVTDTARADFQPMNANFGIIEPLGKKAPKKVRKKMMAERALNDMQGWMKKALL